MRLWLYLKYLFQGVFDDAEAVVQRVEGAEHDNQLVEHVVQADLAEHDASEHVSYDACEGDHPKGDALHPKDDGLIRCLQLEWNSSSALSLSLSLTHNQLITCSVGSVFTSSMKTGFCELPFATLGSQDAVTRKPSPFSPVHSSPLVWSTDIRSFGV